MLSRLFVKNYAIIDESEVLFKDKLNILTGETGAGKSILIGSVNAALGAKTGKDVIRRGADYCTVELVFTNLPERTLKELKDEDIFPDDGEIILSRKITSAGKSICKINGETVSLEELKNCSSLLLDIHGQNEQHSLLKSGSHLKIIDRFAGLEAEKLIARVKDKYEEYHAFEKELKAIEEAGNDKDNDVSYLEYAANEIEAAKLVPGEDEELENEYRTLSNAKQTVEALSVALRLTEDDESGASTLISQAVRELQRASDVDGKTAETAALLESASDLLYDFRRQAEDRINDLENAAERFAFVSERLDTVNSLKKKYSSREGTIEAVLKYAEDAREKIDKLSDLDGYIENLKQKKDKAFSEWEKLSEKLSDLRKKSGKALGEKITAALKELNFAHAVFECEFQKTESIGSNGFDKAEFMISLNPGEPLKPLVKIASGGELSRVMLSVKQVLAEKDEIPTLIFDEIDTGISGRTAQKVSESLAMLSGSHQVICITHLAQIASMADNHFIIEKQNGEESVKTEIRELSKEERKTEIARILGGAEVTDKVMESAEEMLVLAEKKKKELNA